MTTVHIHIHDRRRRTDDIDLRTAIDYARQNEADTLVEQGKTPDKIGEGEFNTRVYEGLLENAASYADQYGIPYEKFYEAAKRSRR